MLLVHRLEVAPADVVVIVIAVLQAQPISVPVLERVFIVEEVVVLRLTVFVHVAVYELPLGVLPELAGGVHPL